MPTERDGAPELARSTAVEGAAAQAYEQPGAHAAALGVVAVGEAPGLEKDVVREAVAVAPAHGGHGGAVLVEEREDGCVRAGARHSLPARYADGQRTDQARGRNSVVKARAGSTAAAE